MKFGKSLSNQIEETLPEWRDKFLSYKDLKKKLKLIDPKREERCSKRPRMASGDGAEAGEMELISMTREEKEFIRLLEEELEKFNFFFVEKEEEYIIRSKELQDRVAKAKDSSEVMIKVWKEIVDFHGEMVLLENYSALNYTGLVKILKKYDKRTGALIRLPFIQRVLQQPFFTTDLLYKLVKECEAMLDSLFPKKEVKEPFEPEGDGNEGEGDGNEGCDTKPTTVKDGLLTVPKELAEIEYMESLYMKSTVSALRVLKEIRSGSSTVSVFSLPPIQGNGVEESWNKVPVLEQEAK
ncbi:SPX domain-containing protein 1-like [Macadamia integrifolia]|uniref:SPX domain-containing protein 1-like n=1 Tax=Macadamia integrifolia TaxID=60698 RepID=UPI001C4F6D36|nr:SPX domain-containing protein 1-like [Macadamia integrifolia]